MIEIFEPGSPEYNRQRAEQELGAARAARLMKARAAHLALAARHLSAAREQGDVMGKSDSGDIGSALQTAFQPPEDDECDDLLELLGRH